MSFARAAIVVSGAGIAQLGRKPGLFSAAGKGRVNS
jgi:hypothetical protein